MEPDRFVDETVEDEATEGLVVRLCCDFGRAGDQFGWIFGLQMDREHYLIEAVAEGEILRKGTLIPFVPGSVPPQVLDAMKTFKSFNADRTSPVHLCDYDVILQCLISSMSWAGIQVEVSKNWKWTKNAHPVIADFSVPMSDRFVDSIADVFGDQRFASEVFSFHPPVRIVK